MNRMIAVVMLALSASIFAQYPQLKSGSTVYIAPMGGYETYLAAAFLKRSVPLVVVTDRNKADFVIISTVSHERPAQSAVVVNNNVSASVNSSNGNNDAWDQGWRTGSGYAAQRALLGQTNTSISVIETKTSQIVFAHSAGSARSNQVQKTAEDCAKHLKEFIEKSEKAKK